MLKLPGRPYAKLPTRLIGAFLFIMGLGLGSAFLAAGLGSAFLAMNLGGAFLAPGLVLVAPPPKNCMVAPLWALRTESAEARPAWPNCMVATPTTLDARITRMFSFGVSFRTLS